MNPAKGRTVPIRFSGTTPRIVAGEQQAAQWVRQMFAGIAPKYDLINHLLSFNVDRLWRKKLANALKPVLQQSEACGLDVCCGTGDVLLELARVTNAKVLGADFCHPMLVAGRAKMARKRLSVGLFEADALELPVRDGVLDAISIAFGFRNLANYQAGLHELHRALKPGGLLGILEFSHPRAFITKTAYGFYSRVFLPIIGAVISGSRDAYRYLPESIRKFPEPEQLCEMMESAGFMHVRFELLSGGIAALHLGWKSDHKGTRTR